MIKGFRDFILKGNVIDLAVAVVIGAAFTAIVDALVAGFIDPLILATVPNVDDLANAWQIGPFKFGLIISAIISFLAKAGVVYFFIVRPFAMMSDRFSPKEEEGEPVIPEDIALLREIRDSLAK